MSSKQMTRLLPVWKLFFPTVTYGLLHYVISSLAQYTVLVSVRADMTERKVRHSTAWPAHTMLCLPVLHGTLSGLV